MGRRFVMSVAILLLTTFALAQKGLTIQAKDKPKPPQMAQEAQEIYLSVAPGATGIRTFPPAQAEGDSCVRR